MKRQTPRLVSTDGSIALERTGSSWVGTIRSLPWPGRTASASLIVQVRVTAEHTAYGVPRVRITPIAGSGSRWVNRSRLGPAEPIADTTVNRGG